MKQMAAALTIVATVMAGCTSKGESAGAGTTGNDTYGTTGTTGATDAVTDADRDFVNELTIANLAEVELGSLAQQRSTNADVKRFGQMMVDDHTSAGQKLSAVASLYHIATPTVIDQKHQELYDKLSALQGAVFDREYTAAMITGHETVLGKLESRIDKVSLSTWRKLMDALPGTSTPTSQPPAVVPEASDDLTTVALNQWAANAYPVVYRHLQAAKTTNDVATHDRHRSTQ